MFSRISSVWFIRLSRLEHCEYDVGELSRYFYDGLLSGHAPPVLGVHPSQLPVAHDEHPRGLDQQRADVLVAAEGHLAVRHPLAAAVARGHEPEIGRELPLVAETADVAHLGEDGHRHGEADAGDPHQQGAVLPVAVGHAQGPDPAGGLEQVGAQCLNLQQQQVERPPGVRQQPHFLPQPGDERPRPVRARP